jgi:serine/threonine-protein kinase
MAPSIPPQTLQGNGTFFALDANTGVKRWSYATGAPIYSSPALSTDGATVFIGSADKQLHAFATKTGTKRWSFPTGNHVDASPVVSEDGATVHVVTALSLEAGLAR